MAAAEPLKIARLQYFDGDEMMRDDIDKRRKIFATRFEALTAHT
jgi:hypothetical protein